MGRQQPLLRRRLPFLISCAGVPVQKIRRRQRVERKREMRREQGVQPPEFMAKQLRPSGPDRCPFMRYQTAIQSRHRGVAQPGSASALGAEGRGFESLRPDQHKLLIFKAIWRCKPRICFLTPRDCSRNCNCRCLREKSEEFQIDFRRVNLQISLEGVLSIAPQKTTSNKAACRFGTMFSTFWKPFRIIHLKISSC